MTTPSILALAGSARRDSLNKKLAAVAADGARKTGAKVTMIDLADYPMPVYNQDIEEDQGLDPNARCLKTLFKEHDGFLIASPENNSAYSALLKNVIDWVSRSEGDEKPLECFRGKYAVIMSASPGGFGGIRGLWVLRMLLSNLGVHVLADQFALSSAHKAFDEHGKLVEASAQERVEALGKTLAETLRKLLDDR